MVPKRLFRSNLHLHPDAVRRIAGVAELPPDSEELAALLAADPAPEVRVAAASRCADVGALAAACANETDATVRAALAAALGTVVAGTQDDAREVAVLEAAWCPDSVCVDVARRTNDVERRRKAIAAI